MHMAAVGVLTISTLGIEQGKDAAYYAPHSRPEGPRRCPDRGNTGNALVFLSKFFLLVIMLLQYLQLQ